MSDDLRKFGLFKNAPNAVTFLAGSVIFRAGDEGRLMYAIKSGQVALSLHGETFDTLGEAEIFGEMALLEHKPRSADAIALLDTELVELNEAQFILYIKQNPHFALQLMRLLSARLRVAHTHL